MPVDDRVKLIGETLMVVGYRNQADTFPYGFFKKVATERHSTGQFEQF